MADFDVPQAGSLDERGRENRVLAPGLSAKLANTERPPTGFELQMGANAIR